MFKLNINGALKYYTIREFEKTGLVRHCFSTRAGGVSKGCFESMNLRMNSGDKKENILENYKIICEHIGVDYNNLVLSKQVHEDNCILVTVNDRGNGIISPQKYDSADALVTNEKGVPLAIFGADCVPVYFLDTQKGAIGLAHSGWRGTVSEIAVKTLKKMSDEFASEPENILVAIGPSIGVCHFEVGEEVSDVFRAKFGEEVLEKHDKYHVNMQKAIEIQLIKAGVREKNIVNCGICTCCNPDLFYSHRACGDNRGVMAAIMELI